MPERDRLNQLAFFSEQPVIRLVALPGHSHRNWLVITATGQFFVRCYQPSAFSLSRFTELKCQLKAARAGFSPPPLYYNASSSTLITEFLSDNQPFVYSSLSAQQLAASLAMFHQFRIKTFFLDSVGYLQQLKSAVADVLQVEEQLFGYLLQAAAKHAALPQDMVLCHRDLNPDNILLSQQQVYLIDFEYVCRADYSFDLASFSVHQQLDALTEQQWLHYYRSVRPVKDDIEMMRHKVALAKLIYAGWCWLWYLAFPAYQQQALYWQQHCYSLLPVLYIN